MQQSRFSQFYLFSVVAYVLSLLAPDGSGLFMLAFGWIAASIGASAAWFGNLIMIAALVLARNEPNPWRWHWVAYAALALMLSGLGDGILKEVPIWYMVFFLLWISSPVLLIIGMQRYRRVLQMRGQSDFA